MWYVYIVCTLYIFKIIKNSTNAIAYHNAFPGQTTRRVSAKYKTSHIRYPKENIIFFSFGLVISWYLPWLYTYQSSSHSRESIIVIMPCNAPLDTHRLD